MLMVKLFNIIQDHSTPEDLCADELALLGSPEACFKYALNKLAHFKQVN